MKKIAYLGWVFLLCLLISEKPVALHASVSNVLCRIADRSRESQSDSVIITSNGLPIFEYTSGKYWEPIDTLSITKSIVALAIGILIDEEALALDMPVYLFYPEWNQGLKQNVTIKHLLAQTSGLQYDGSLESIDRANNIIQLALCAELTTAPGTLFYYNNKAVNLLSGIIEKTTGMNVNQFLAIKLFRPLGIRNVSWLADPSGHEYAMAHLNMTAPDLIKIGELLQNQGWHNDRQLISKRWIDIITTPGQSDFPFYGLLWWINYYSVACYWDDCLLNQYCIAGVSQEFIQRLKGLDGRLVYIDGSPSKSSNYLSREVIDILGGDQNADQFFQQIKEKNLPLARWNEGSLRAFAARGYKGQQLIVLPGKKIVAVRQIHVCKANGEDTFNDFGALIEELAYYLGCQQ